MHRTMLLFRLWACLLGLSMGLAAQTQAQGQANDPMDPNNPRPARTTGEAMGREGRALGQSYAEFLRLRQEGAANIARLERALAACGNCAERSRLEAELSQVRTAESQVRRAEADTLQGMGLGQHDSIQDLVRAMGSALGGKHDFGTDHTRERISRIVSDHCRGGQTQFDVSKLVGCIGEKKPEQQLVLFKTALTYCQQRAGDNFVNLCRSGEACDAFEGCMRANSEAVSLCADNVSRGIAQERVPRCFAYMLHPGIFAGGGGVGRSALPVGPAAQRAPPPQNPQRDERVEAGRQRMCDNINRQLDRQRADLARRPSSSLEHALKRSETAFDNHRCGER
jgi:hypothetical protein